MMSETVTRREALEELAKRRARENLSSFVLYNHDDYIMGWSPPLYGGLFLYIKKIFKKVV